MTAGNRAAAAAPSKRSKRTYQMDPANSDGALREALGEYAMLTAAFENGWLSFGGAKAPQTKQ